MVHDMLGSMTSHAPNASQAEPEGYAEHLDSIELRIVRMPAEAAARIATPPLDLGTTVADVRFIRARRRGAPPINPHLAGLTVIGHVNVAGAAALVGKAVD